MLLWPWHLEVIGWVEVREEVFVASNSEMNVGACHAGIVLPIADLRDRPPLSVE